VLVEEELARVSPVGDTLLTIGVFDGVHLGHKRLISELLKEAGQKGLHPGLVTFRQHPEDLLTPVKKLPFLTDIKTRIKLLHDEGIEIIVPLSFTAHLARLDARHFIELLQKHLRMRGLVVGTDFALGKGREGDTEALERLGKEMGFTVTVVPPLKINGEVVSSTAVRDALAKGDMKRIRELTGHAFNLRGRVVAGAGRGDALGFPTANLDASSGQALPPDGVYAGLARIDGKVYRSMTNIGRNPTFGDADRTIESYLVDFHGDLYGSELQLDIVERLRDEKKFGSAEELKKQMAKDVLQGETILKSLGMN
jgi:riboflavin kinase/FMN adenylyltransferase